MHCLIVVNPIQCIQKKRVIITTTFYIQACSIYIGCIIEMLSDSLCYVHVASFLFLFSLCIFQSCTTIQSVLQPRRREGNNNMHCLIVVNPIQCIQKKRVIITTTFYIQACSIYIGCIIEMLSDSLCYVHVASFLFLCQKNLQIYYGKHTDKHFATSFGWACHAMPCHHPLTSSMVHFTLTVNKMFLQCYVQSWFDL